MSLSNNKSASPYGLWKSTLTPNLIANKLRFSDVQCTGNGLLWLEGRPTGSVLVHGSKNTDYFDVAPQHQPHGDLAYGGGEFHTRNGMIAYVTKDSSIYRTSIQDQSSQLLLTEVGSISSPNISPDGKFVLYLHSDGKDDSIKLINLTKSEGSVRLLCGADFYMQPAWHPEGNMIAWVEWDAPNMPWDGALLKTAQFDRITGRISDIRTIAGDTKTPVFQPEF
jgi:hypothetical protein